MELLCPGVMLGRLEVVTARDAAAAPATREAAPVSEVAVHASELTFCGAAMTARPPEEACPTVRWAAWNVSPAKWNILMAIHGAKPPIMRISDPAASCVVVWPAPPPLWPAPSNTARPMLRMMTSSSLETIIAATNSIQRRTHARVMSAVAPANASGARTAAMISSSLRIIIAAQTMTTAARIDQRQQEQGGWRLDRSHLRERELSPEAFDVGAERVLDIARREHVDDAQQGARRGEGDGRADEADHQAGQGSTEPTGLASQHRHRDLDDEQREAQDAGDGRCGRHLPQQLRVVQVEGGCLMNLLPQPCRRRHRELAERLGDPAECAVDGVGGLSFNGCSRLAQRVEGVDPGALHRAPTGIEV